MADVAEILVHWDAGEGISAIATTLGYSRPTVRKYVAAAVRAGLSRGSGRRRQLGWEALASEIIAREAAVRTPGSASAKVARFHATLASKADDLQLSVLYQRLHDEHQLDASWGTFYRYYARHFGPVRPGPEATSRHDDPPSGEEGQVDFFYLGPWADPEAGRVRKVYAFLMTLSASRHGFLYPALKEDAEAFFAGHVHAFSFFGGAPKRLVPDNLTAAILKADLYDPRLNKSYSELTRYYGCIVDPSRVAHPKDKPRVERMGQYARQSFFRDRAFTSLADMRQKAREWCLVVAGKRIQGTTRERPLDSFLALERPALLPLPPAPWEQVTWTTARVHPDCHLSVGGARYSVPHLLVGKRLDVRLSRTLVTIYDDQEVVTSHARRERGRSTKVEHYPDADQAFLRNTPQVCLERAAATGPATSQLVRERLTVHALHNLREVQSVLGLASRYTPERLEEACRRALDSTDARYRTVRGILERELDLAPAEEPPPAPVESGAFLRGPEALLAGVGQS